MTRKWSASRRKGATSRSPLCPDPTNSRASRFYRYVPVYLDTGGSVLDDRTIEMATEILGPERVLFATDNVMESGVGRIFSADLTDEHRNAILWQNMQAILKRRKS